MVLAAGGGFYPGQPCYCGQLVKIPLFRRIMYRSAGKKVKIENGKESFQGKANGIDESGGLLIKLRNGKEKVLHAGDVSLLL